MFLSRGDRDLGVAFQTHPGRQAFISSGSKEPRSALESRRVSLGAHWVDSRESSLLRRLRSEEHTSELQSPLNLVCRLLLEKKKKNIFFFFNDTATTEIYTLSLHDALPISGISWSSLGGLKGVKPPEAFGERSRDWSLGHAGDEGPHLSMTGESRGCSRAAAPVCGFSRVTTARSVSLSWGATEVGSPCEWLGGARHCSRAMLGESGLETC